MKLWLISQDTNNGYDTYDSAVVAAETQDAAKLIHPNRYGDEVVKLPEELKSYSTWASLPNISATYLGEAADGTEPGVICASFNAG